MRIRILATHAFVLFLLLAFNNCSPFKAPADNSNSSSSSGCGMNCAPPSTGYIAMGTYDSFVGPTFDYTKLIATITSTTANYGPQEGAFRFTCYPSHEAYDDPIVYPGHPGLSHLHEFFGNTKSDAFSTYESLRNNGDSSCGSVLNRSAYWMPAMLNPDESMVIHPDIIVVYYKRESDGATACTKSAIDCKPFPKGLRFIYGYNFATGDPGVEHWQCLMKDGTGLGLKNNIVDAAKGCEVGGQLEATLDASPNCWDGVNLDTPDHRSHLTYGSYGSWGYYKCPSTHPHLVPRYTIKAFYTIDNTLDLSGTYTPGVTKTWHLSSDHMVQNAIPGQTLHADWFGAWDDKTMDRWMKGCINGALSCNNGDLGDGGQMPDAAYAHLPVPPRLVPVPPMP